MSALDTTLGALAYDLEVAAKVATVVSMISLAASISHLCVLVHSLGNLF